MEDLENIKIGKYYVKENMDMKRVKILKKILTPFFYIKYVVLYFYRIILYNITDEIKHEYPYNNLNKCDICGEYVENKMCANTNKAIWYGKHDVPLKGHPECLWFYTNTLAGEKIKTFIRGYNALTEDYFVEYKGAIYNELGYKLDAEYWSEKILGEKVF